MTNSKNDKYRYWTKIAIDHLSFSNNLFLTICIAAIAFILSEKDDVYKTIIFDKSLKIDWNIVLYISSIILLSFSIFSGIITVLTRLLDFRITRNSVLVDLIANKNDQSLDLHPKAFKPMKNNLCLFLYLLFSNKYLMYREELQSKNEGERKHHKKRLRTYAKQCSKMTWFNF